MLSNGLPVVQCAHRDPLSGVPTYKKQCEIEK